MTHAEELGLRCVKDATKRWGSGWRMLSLDLKRAAVCEEVVSVLLMQRTDDASAALIHAQDVARAALRLVDPS